MSEQEREALAPEMAERWAAIVERAMYGCPHPLPSRDAGRWIVDRLAASPFGLVEVVRQAKHDGKVELASELKEVKLTNYEQATTAQWLDYVERTNAVLAPYIPQA